MIDAVELPDELSAVVRSLPGVSTIYSSAPVHATVATHLAKVVVRERPGEPSVLVAAGERGTTVTVTIGVSDVEPATDVCRRVHDAILDHVVARGLPTPAAIEVRVASIGS